MKQTFSLVYQYLQTQVFAPSVKVRLRVYMVKDNRMYKREHHKFMQQLISSRWPGGLQRIDTDNLVLKQFIKGVGVFMVVAVMLYVGVI